MLSPKDVKLIKYFKQKILDLKYGRRIEYTIVDDDNLLSNRDHIISIHRLDNDHYVLKLIYKLSSNDIVKIN